MSRCVALLACVTLAVACSGRPRGTAVESEGDDPSLGVGRASGGAIAEFDLTAGAPESTQTGGLFQLPVSRTFIGLVRSVQRAHSDENVRGALVQLGAQTLDFAQSEGISRMFGELRRRGKPVVCHAHSLDNSSAWLVMKSCDKVWLSPAGVVDTVGIAAQVTYVKGLLDRLHVDADFVSAGKYKSFAESLTREGPTDEARESLTETLSSIRRTWLDSASARAVKVGQALEHGPWTAEQAKARGIVDAIGYPSDALEDIKSRTATSTVAAEFGPKASQGAGLNVTEIVRLLAGADDRAGGRPRVAVVPAEGGITMESGGLFEVSGITARAMQKTLERLEKDEAVRAVVVRIDSPGGSALASDLIWKQLMRLRKKKPVIASIGSMAASGGYYLAAAANAIVAERTSIVGSIGVVAGKIVIGSAFEQIGVNNVVFPASPEPNAAARAAYSSPMVPWNDIMRAKVKDQINAIYGLFVARVAEGRRKPTELIKKSAEGRSWSGAQGLENGFVDRIGGLHQALQLARRLGALDPDAPVSVEGVSDSLLEMLFLAEDASSVEIIDAYARWQARSTPIQRLIPAPLRPFVKSLEPLLSNEHVLTAVPFAFTLR